MDNRKRLMSVQANEKVSQEEKQEEKTQGKENKEFDKNLDEKIIYFTIILTYPLYLIGGLYLVGPILAWILLYRSLVVIFNVKMKIHHLSIVWIVSILLIEVVVVIGSLNTGHSVLMTIKSTIGWAKGWALIGIFIFIGSILPIRYYIFQRAIINILWQSLLISPFLIVVAFLNFPTLLYISPLKFFGGGGEQFFKVWLYWNDLNTGLPRWQLFAPWSPALAFYALLALSIILPCPSDKTKYVALFSAIVLVFLSLLFVMPWMAEKMNLLTIQLFDQIVAVGGG